MSKPSDWGNCLTDAANLETTQLKGHDNFHEGVQLYSNHVHHHQTETIINTIYSSTNFTIDSPVPLIKKMFLIA